MALGIIRRSFIIFTLLAALPSPAAATINACLTTVRLEKLGASPSEAQTAQRHNGALANLLKVSGSQFVEMLVAANTFVSEPTPPVQFVQGTACTPLTLLISTSGANFFARLLYNGHQLSQAVTFATNWRFDQDSATEPLKQLVLNALAAMQSVVPDICRQLFVRLVNEETERLVGTAGGNSRFAVRISPGNASDNWCQGTEICAVLPTLTLNDYLLFSSFMLQITLADGPGQLPVIFDGFGVCSPYNDGSDLGIVVRNQQNRVPQRPWGQVSFSLHVLNLPPRGSSCRRAVGAPIGQPEARGAR